MHFVAAKPGALTVAMDRTGNFLVDDLLAKLLETNGSIVLPQGPGPGIALNDETVARYAIPQGNLALPGNYSDMVFA